MAKYEKRGSSSRTKRKKIEALPVVVEAGSSYIDELIRVQKELQEALFTYMRFPKKPSPSLPLSGFGLEPLDVYELERELCVWCFNFSETMNQEERSADIRS